MRSTVYYILREHQLDCVHCWHHVVTGVDCWQFALGHLDICTSIDLCLLIFGFKCGIWTAPSKETKMGKFVLVGWGSTFKLVIVSLSRWVREIWFGRQNGPIFFCFLVYLSRRLKCTIVIMRCPYSVRPSVVNFSHVRLLLWKRWTELNETLQEARSQRLLPSLCFSDRSEKKMAALVSDWLKHFRLTLCNHWTVLNEIWQGARSKHPLPS